MVKAKIKFIVDRTFYSKYRPMIKLRDDMCNSCQLNFKNKITCNEEVETYIIFACDNLVYPYLYVDKKFDLYEGKTKVGEGIIIKISNT